MWLLVGLIHTPRGVLFFDLNDRLCSFFIVSVFQNVVVGNIRTTVHTVYTGVLCGGG